MYEKERGSGQHTRLCTLWQGSTEVEARGRRAILTNRDNVMFTSFSSFFFLQGHTSQPPEVNWDNMIGSGEGNVTGSDVYHT